MFVSEQNVRQCRVLWEGGCLLIALRCYFCTFALYLLVGAADRPSERLGLRGRCRDGPARGECHGRPSAARTWGCASGRRTGWGPRVCVCVCARPARHVGGPCGSPGVFLCVHRGFGGFPLASLAVDRSLFLRIRLAYIQQDFISQAYQR